MKPWRVFEGRELGCDIYLEYPESWIYHVDSTNRTLMWHDVNDRISCFLALNFLVIHTRPLLFPSQFYFCQPHRFARRRNLKELMR